MSPDLKQIVEEGYRRFEAYRPGSPLAVCMCNVCMDEQCEAALRTLPLRDITPVLLFEYNNSCHDRCVPQAMDEYRYFLPRYLELIAAGQGEALHPDYWTSGLCRLGEIKWRRDWKPDEVDHVDRFFSQLMLDAVADQELVLYRPLPTEAGEERWRLRKDIEDVFVLVESAGGDRERAFETMYAAQEPASSLHLANYCVEHMQLPRRNDPLFARGDVAAKLEAAFFDEDEPRRQKLLSDGLEVLRSYLG